MWRWLVPIGLVAAVTSVHVLLNGIYYSPPHGQYQFGALTFGWIGAFVRASPTVLYYRLLIWIGEKGVRRRPVAGALLAVATGAIVPPLTHNLVADWSRPSRNFRAAPPADVATIAVDQPDTRSLLENGFVPCGEMCLRLLYGGTAKQVIVGDPAARSAYERRPIVSGTEPRMYPTAWALRLDRRPICPPVAVDLSRRDSVTFPGGILINPAQRGRDGRSAADRAIALMASGLCIVGKPAVFGDADLRLGEGSLRRGTDAPLLPNRFGLDGASFQFVEARDGQKWRRLSQRVPQAVAIRWSYPFGFLPDARSWVAAVPVVDGLAASRENQPWQWAGIRVPDVPAVDDFRIRQLLQTALDSPAGRPRDARHLLARQYLLQLGGRPIDDVDRALIPRLILDPRVPASDLQLLVHVARRSGAPPLGALLVRRIRQTGREPGDVRMLASLVAGLPRNQWAAILPEIRNFAADPAFAGEAAALFRLFEAGGADDASLLLQLFEREWPPKSLARHPHPVPEAVRNEVFASRRRVGALLEGLCALHEGTPAIRDRLLRASKTVVPVDGSADEIGTRLWRTLARMGVAVDRLAAEQGVDPVIVGRINRGSPACGGGRSASPQAGAPAPPYPVWHKGREWLPLDALILLVFVGGSAALAMRVARKRARSAEGNQSI